LIVSVSFFCVKGRCFKNHPFDHSGALGIINK